MANLSLMEIERERERLWNEGKIKLVVGVRR